MNDDIDRGEAIIGSGKHASARGELLGTIAGWGLPVYEGSPSNG